jgi:hypothetical protein
MYNISTDLRDLMKSPAIMEHIRGTIGNVPFTERNILRGSLNITNQCGANNGVLLGTTYIGQMQCTFVDLTIAQWENSVIYLEIGVEVGNSIEYVPVGFYTVNSADWSATGMTVLAYDDMRLFDRTFPKVDISGIPYAIITQACTVCGVTMAQADFSGFPNADATFILSADNECVTWRDVVSAVAQFMGAFLTINREGELELRIYPAVADAVDAVDADERLKDCTFSDFETKYIGVSCVDRVSKETKEHILIGSGTIYELGSNPFLQGRDDYDTILANIMGVLANIRYTPCTVNLREGIYYDLGDVIQSDDSIVGDCNICVMSFIYRMGRNIALQTFGKNPSLATAKSKTDKYIENIQTNVFTNTKGIDELKQSAIVFLLPNAIDDRSLLDGESRMIIHWSFECADGAQVAVNAMLNFEITITGQNPATLLVTIKLDDNTAETYTAEYEDGTYILNMSHIMTINDSDIHELTMELAISGGDLT